MKRPILPYLGIFLTACFISQEASGQEASKESYWVRGEEIVLDRDTTALALELAPGAVLEKALPGGAGEIQTHFSDPVRGRYLFRFETEKELARVETSKSSLYRTFPVYTHASDPTPIWCFTEVALRIKEEGEETAFKKFLEAADLEIRFQSPFNPTRFVVQPTAPSEKSAFESARELLEQPFTRWAEPAFYGGYHLHTPPPDDPLFPNQVFHNLIGTLKAWDLTFGSSSVVVAVLDEGIDPIHPDLVANLWQNPGESPTPDGIDDDGNGFIDDLHGWDFTDNNGDTTPVAGVALGGHGTAVAGIVAAVRNNAEGVTGIAPGVRLMSLRTWIGGAFIAGGVGTALEYAATYADVVNISWGGTLPTNDVLDGIDFAATNGRGGKGTLVVASAGNRDGGAVLFPARYPWAVAVAESDLNDLKHDESAFDKTLSLIAPEALWSTDSTGPGNGFETPPGDYVGFFGGTSSAAPQASAVAALILSRNPGLTAGEVVCHLANGADNVLPGIVENDLYGKSPTMGYGRINAYRSASFGSSYVDDRLEPNDTPEQAATVTTGFYPWLYLRTNPDFYRVDATGGAPIFCSIESLGDLGEMEVVLLDSNLQEVASSSNSGNPFPAGNTILHTLFFVPTVSGTYYLQVRPLFGDGQAYRMEVQVAAADDAFEPNDSVAEAPLLDPGAGATYKDLAVNDDDYYRVHLNNGEYLYGMVTFNHSQGNLAYQVLAPNGTTVLDQDDLTSYGEFFAGVQATQTGDHFVRVYSSQADLQREYSLHLAVSNQAPLAAGSDDGFEDDDTVATSATIVEGYYPNLALGFGGGEEDDNFRFTLPAGKRGRLTFGESHFAVDLDIRVFPDEVFSTTPSLVAPFVKSSRQDVPVESVEIPASGSARDFLIQIRRTFEGSQVHTHYSFALEFLETKPTPWVAYWRFQEGRVGEQCDPETIRDWRGPLFSDSPSGYGGLEWTAAPGTSVLPGSDGVALDCSSGGVYFPGNGNFGELDLGNSPFTLWIRFDPGAGETQKFLAGIPGVWEFTIDNGDRLTLTARSGAMSQTHVGPAILSSGWQDAAVVWNPNTPATGVRILGTAEMGLVETVLPITVGLSGTGIFHIGSTTAGGDPVGSVEQVRYYDEALSLAELQGFSTTMIPSAHSNWTLYR